MEPLKHLLFIDIESVCCEAEYSVLSQGLQREWIRKVKSKWSVEEGEAAQACFDKAGILAELKNACAASPSSTLHFEEGEAAQAFFDKAGILAEFGKVVCISM